MKDGTTPLTEGTDYTIEAVNGIDYVNASEPAANPADGYVKDKSITIVGMGNYAATPDATTANGTKTVTFAIEPKNIADTDVDKAVTNLTYNPEGKEPTFTLTYGEQTLVRSDSENNNDYSVTYNNGEQSVSDYLASAGDKEYKLTGYGNYTGETDWIKFTDLW